MRIWLNYNYKYRLQISRLNCFIYYIIEFCFLIIYITLNEKMRIIKQGNCKTKLN